MNSKAPKDFVAVKRAMEADMHETDDQQGSTHKKMKSDTIFTQGYSAVAQRIMASMGYKPGEGLGLHGTGIVAPVGESDQRGRRGLGFSTGDAGSDDNEKWIPEEILYEPKPEWIRTCELPVPRFLELKEWMKVGTKKDSIEDETTFCDPEVLCSILKSKSEFDLLNNKEFLDARRRSNPYETIRGAIFQNRAAMKMANIDAVFNFMFTQAVKPEKPECPEQSELLYFADICAGPGGFSEYVLWRKKWHAKGFGFTLKDTPSGSDFKLDAFLVAPCETFEPHYGEGGVDGDGDVTKPNNLTAFKDYVLERTEKKGVHFVMADGGISTEGQENIQEILTKQLVLCQFVCGLSILRTGGTFVCKVFDQFTPFSVGLLYLLYRCFRHVCLFKPVTSRPANSERYVICTGFRTNGKEVHDYLYYINDELLSSESDMDVLQVVPMELLCGDISFYTYVQAFNNSFGTKQVQALKKLKYFVKNEKLEDFRQQDVRRTCLKLWKIPDIPRVPPSSNTAENIFQLYWSKLCEASDDPPSRSLLNSTSFQAVTRQNIPFEKYPFSWKWYWACGKRYIIVGLGRRNVHAWDAKSDKPTFRSDPKLKLELPRGTVLETELVEECEGEGRGQKKTDVLYIVDVIAIGDEFYGTKPPKERLLIAEKLCQAVNKVASKELIMLKTKYHYRINELKQSLESMISVEQKGANSLSQAYSIGANKHIAPAGIIFFKTVRDPWELNKQLHFFNVNTLECKTSCPASSVSSFISTLRTRHIWLWSNKTFTNHDDESEDEHDESYLNTDLTKTYMCTRLTCF